MTDTDPDIREMEVVKKAKQIVKNIYLITKHLPSEERYGLGNQIQRAAVSIPSNIVEGNQRGKKEFIHFLQIARGSLYETKLQLELMLDLYTIPVDPEETYTLIDEVGKMTYALIKSLKSGSVSDSGGQDV